MKSGFLTGLAASLFLCPSLFAGTVIVTTGNPFTTNFDEYTGTDPIDGTAGRFTASGTGTFSNSITSLGGSNLALSQSASGPTTGTGSGAAIAAVNTTGLTANGGGFTVSTTFLTTTAGTTGTTNLSVNGAASSTFGTGYRLVYTTFAATGTGTLSFARNGTTIGTSAGAVISGSFVPSSVTPLTLSMTVLYNSNNNATIIGALYNGTTQVASLSFTDTNTVQRGEYFGVRTAASGAGANETITYTDFTLAAVPEPASAALAGMAGLLLTLRRRRA